MNDIDSVILDSLKEIRIDIKQLSTDVTTLKTKSMIWGVIGGAVVTILISIVPIIFSHAKVFPQQTYSSTVIPHSYKDTIILK